MPGEIVGLIGPNGAGKTTLFALLTHCSLLKQIKDEHDYVYIVDRLKELIKCKGLQVAPAEIEHILVGHREVQDAAVIAEAHADFGEVPVAYVVLRPQAKCTANDLIEYAAQGLAKYKRLARVNFIEAIPRSPSGKILRRVLKDGQSLI